MREPRRRKRRIEASREQASSPPPSHSSVSFTSSPFHGRALWIVAALIVSIVIIYAPVRHYEFVSWDDPQYVIENSHLTGGLTWPNVSWAFTSGYLFYWQPLTWLSHMLDVQLYGLNAGPHHVTNLLLHIANTVLLFGILYRMTASLGRSAFVAALFAVHPLRVESVAWVAERKDLLSTLFWMLTVWEYIAYVRQPRLGRYLLALMLFAAALMAKPMVVTLPFVLLLLDYWPLGRVPQRSAWPGLAREKLPLFALAIAVSIITFAVKYRAGTVAALDALPVIYRVENALVSYIAYVGMMLWPARLAAFYPFRAVAVWWASGAILVLIGVTAALIRAGRRYPYLSVGWLWYLVALAPVIGLIQAGAQARADRFTYVPLIGLFTILAWGIPDLLAGWRYRHAALPAAAALVLLACASVTHAQVRYWKDSFTLWGRALAVTTDNYRAHSNLAVALAEKGRLDEAIPHYLEALRLWPEDTETHTNVANALAEKGRPDEAILHYSEAIRINPNNADARNNLAAAQAQKGNLDEAIDQLSEAVRIKPNDPTLRYNLGVLNSDKGNVADAERHLKAALALKPHYQDARRALDELGSRGK